MSKGMCEVDGCNRPEWCDFLCQAHYMRKYRTGKVGDAKIGKPRFIGRFGGRKVKYSGCLVAGCERKHSAHGYCNAHYMRVWRNGDVGGAEIKEKPVGCVIDGCDRKHEAKGYCKIHYLRFWRHGDPNVVLVNPNPPKVCTVDGCNRPYHAKGYCELHYKRQRRKTEAEYYELECYT